MESPRTPGDGIAGALESLGGENSEAYISRAGLPLKFATAAVLDRQADLHLAEGRVRQALPTVPKRSGWRWRDERPPRAGR